MTFYLAENLRTGLVYLLQNISGHELKKLSKREIRILDEAYKIIFEKAKPYL